MKQPTLTLHRIFLYALILGVGGLLSEFIAFMDFPPMRSNELYHFVNRFLSNVYLNIYNSSWLGTYRRASFQYFTYLNSALYILLIAGALLYRFSAGKETRFIRFALSIVLFSTALGLLMPLINIAGYYSELKVTPYLLINWLVAMGKNAFFAWLCWSMLIKLQLDKSLDEKIVSDSDSSYYVGAEASGWQRCFHVVVDLFFTFALLSFLLSMPFVIQFMKAIRELAGERLALAFYFFFASSIYYLFFEMLIGATPAKLLTECRVVTDIGQQPSFNTILTRTFARQIPFNAFSFLGSKGWHDSISNTLVVKEIRTGASGIKYILLLPTLVIVASVACFVNDRIQKNQAMKAARLLYNEKMQGIKDELSHLTTASILALKQVPENYQDQLFFKVDSVGTDSIRVGYLFLPLKSSNQRPQLEQAFVWYSPAYPTRMLSKKDVLNAITTDYEADQQGKRNAIAFLGDEKRYEISGVYTLQSANLAVFNEIRYPTDGGFTMGFQNCGQDARIIGIDILEGGLSFSDQLPLDVPGATFRYCAGFQLTGKDLSKGDTYKFRLTLDDKYGKQFSYIVSGINDERTIRKEFK